MSKKQKPKQEMKDGLPVVDAETVLGPDPLRVPIGPAHVVKELQNRYPQVFDACLGFASAVAVEQQARTIMADKDKEIEELKAKLAGKCAISEAEQIMADGIPE